MHYHISFTNPGTRFVNFVFTITDIRQDIIHIQLPSWRPGRYELQNYAKNIRNLIVTDSDNHPLSYAKTSKDRWEIDTKGTAVVIIRYEYFANQPDAGASYVCDEFLYLNPVNCMMYMEGRADEPYTIEFSLPEDYVIATQLTSSGKHRLSAPDFDYLADSPLIASPSLKHYPFTINDGKNNLNIWFQGNHPFDIERLIHDTKIYAEAQTKLFGEMPSSNYHFLYLMLSSPFRHGVEHLDSTVIAMGQGPDTTDEEFYNDLLAISCHELFHLWNIKRIRPADMLPYDFTKENYSTLGYVYEGVTTYYGNLILLRSGVWNLNQYLNRLSEDLRKHLMNPGRFNYSLAESSWDTWLDGYVAGIPGRKVSIYTEGLIVAWISDHLILKNSKGKYRLDDVMKELFQHDFAAGIGYTEERYRQLLEKYSGISFESFFKELIHGKSCWQEWLSNVLTLCGLEMELTGDEANLKVSLRVNEKLDKITETFFLNWINSIQ